MRHLKAHVERVSLEEAGTTAVEIPPKDPVVEQVESEPEPVEELISDMIVEPDPAADSARAELDETMQIQTSIEHYQELLRGAEARGGLRPVEGALLGVSTRHFQKRLGMDGGVLSMEDFGGNMSRLKATTVSQEGLADMAKAAGAKILELIKRLVEVMKTQIQRFDVQGQKVAAVVTDMKKRIGAFVLGETTYEWDGNQYLNARDLENPKTLIEAVSKLTAANDYLSSFFKMTSGAIVAAVRNPEDEGAATEFNNTVENCWVRTNPFANLFRDNIGYPLSSVGIAHLAYKGSDNGPVGAHSMQIDRKETSPIKVTITKQQFKTLVDSLHTYNTALTKLIKEASANSGTIGGINGIQNQLGQLPQDLQSAITKAVNGMVINMESDIMPIVSYMSSCRGELAYMVAHIGRAFGKNVKA